MKMIRLLLGTIATITITFMSACGGSETLPSTQVVEVTKIVPQTQIVEMTRVIHQQQVQQVAKTKIIPVTRIVQVTQVVPVTQIVEIPITAPTEAPAVLEPPAMEEPTAILTVPPAIPESNGNLLVWYDFDDNFLSSGYVCDKSGNGYDAQVYGTVGIGDGISDGRSIYFSGDSYILAPVNPAAGRNKVSFSFWFKTEHPENNYKLASAAWWNGGPGSGWIMATHAPEFWSDNTQSLYAPGMVNIDNPFIPDEWTHEVVTYDGTRLKEYTNGQLVNDWAATGAAIGQGEVMAVGAWPQFGGFNFVGGIDEFRIYSKSLTRQEIRTLYNQGQ